MGEPGDKAKKESFAEQIDWTNWINHELKTPLNRMESLLQGLSKSPRCGFEEKKIIFKLNDSLKECKSTLDSLYFYNKIKVNKVRPRLTLTDINMVLKNAIQDIESSLALKGHQVILELEPLFPIPLDEQLFKRAVLNVIENAIKFSPSKSKILISSEEIGDKILVQVADQGPGIKKSTLSNIFQPYFRSEDHKNIPGTGLGLYITESFIGFHGGKVEVDSVEGSGTTFTFTLPKEQPGV